MWGKIYNLFISLKYYKMANLAPILRTYEVNRTQIFAEIHR